MAGRIAAARSKLRALVARLATEHGTPARLFAACVVGAMVGSTPLFGLHLPICLALAVALRLNKVVVYAAANVSIPPLAPFLAAACIEVGSRLLFGHSLAASVASLRHAEPWSMARDVVYAWLLGAPIVGGAIGVALGAIVAATAAARRDAADPFRPIVRAVSARFAGAPIGLRQYAFWKLRLDPVYRALSVALAGRRDVVDLGTGLGLLPIVLALSDPAVRVHGIEWDAEKLAAGVRAAEGLPVTLVAGDVRTATIPSCDALSLVDVLHYFDADAQRALLARAIAALRPGGVLVVREGDRARTGARWTTAIENLAVRLGWNRSASRPTWRTIEALRADLEALGLEVEVVPVAGPLHPGNVLLRCRVVGACAPDSSLQAVR